jgi:uncharacterized membrane protein YgdD (TMEM256/DUF423 family)
MDFRIMHGRFAFALGALFAALTVAAGAFGAHALRQFLRADQLAVYETAVRYQGMHALGLFAVAWAIERWPGRPARAAGWLFLCGIGLFCGSLYAIALFEIRGVGMLTPLGGMSFIAGWLCLVAAAVKKPPGCQH